ncbi:MAG: carcinine hydrolase/isopenicillin-N N-acyltransferase family protein, partial [Candidatus Hermodarchaeota archaeon]
MESASACSIITVSSMNSVFFGYNEDESEGDSTIHDLYLVFSPENTSYCHEVTETYGHLFILYKTNNMASARVGMNTEGLAISGNGISEYLINPHPERLYDLDEYSFYNKVLEECSNVSEAINMAREFDFSPAMAYQMHIADANGDAVIIAPRSDGEVAFVQKENSSYLISTNFNRADSENKEYPCPRYEKAEAELEKIKPEDDLKLDFIRSILDALHYEGFQTNTVYSQIFDLKNRISYLYYWHHYSEVVSLNLTQELTKGKQQIPLLTLFSQELIDKGSQEFQTNQTIVLEITLVAIIIGVAFVVLLGISVRRTAKNSTLPTKWKILQITIFLIG